MTKMVQIQSSITIKVTPGLQNKDVTNPDAHVPDRLKINPEWPKYQVLITQGVGKYPAEICDWPSVQALAKDNILTIGAITDVDDAALEDKEKTNVDIVNEAKEEFKLGANVKQTRKAKTLTLNDLTENN